MFFHELSTDDVLDYIEEDAGNAFELWEERGEGCDESECVWDGIGDRLTYVTTAIEVIAWAGAFDALTYEGNSYEDSPAAQYKNAVFDRFYELVEEAKGEAA